jgi:HlyD family secretion protein
MKRKILFTAIGIIIIAIIFFATRFKKEPGDELEITTQIKRNTFKIEVTSAGELDAKKSVKILGPTGLRTVYIWEVKIENIVDEGTLVKKGDYVARLDPTQVTDRIEKKDAELLQSTSEYTQAKLDTALELRKARDELVNLKYEIEQKKIVLEQSSFEPPATQKQNQYELEKAERAHQQAIDNYQLKKEKAEAQVTQAYSKMKEHQRILSFLNDLRGQLTITAPEDGMLIYVRNWRGEKLGEGSTVGSWDPVVATLPDLTKMISKTYINEVDINFVRKDQEVTIGLDAFPEKELTGTVVDVANIGEQRPNTDAKVYQVTIDIHESDTTLRPGMTTSNSIIAEEITDVLSVPVECIHSQGDTLTYIYKREGIGFTKQEVKTGKSNSDETIIMEGLDEGDVLYLSDPAGAENKMIKLLAKP